MDNKIGKLVWFDLTAQNADKLKGFYEEVVGWKAEPLSMGNYDDYVMKTPETDEGISGVCHARGSNAYLPPQWLIYIQVKNMDESLENCKRLGGKIIGEKRKGGETATYCLIQDPEGAYMMLFEGQAQ